MFNKNQTVEFWRCEFFNSNDIKCKARLHRDHDGNIIRQLNEHNCPSGAENVGAKRVITALKRRAAETMEPPAILRGSILQNVPTPVLANIPNKYAMKKIIKRTRNKMDAPPAVPTTIEELEIPHNYQIYKRTEDLEEQFLLADSGAYFENGRQQRILIFGRETYKNWSAEMQEIFADGTFSLAPPLFSQIYVILARKRNWVFPILYCLLTEKTQSIYERMWNLIVDIWPEFAPQSISIDYETSSIKAIKNIFANCEIRGCLYHLTHNLKKKLAEAGLTQLYRSDAQFAIHCRMITAVAFLPVQDITLAVMAFDSGFMPPELDSIIDWFFLLIFYFILRFVINYTGRLRMNGTRTASRFSPEIWNVYQRTLEGEDRTNNFAESNHRRLQHAFSCTHPSFWRLVNTLRREQKSRDADMAKCIGGEEPPLKSRRYREADARILNLVENYQPINQGNPYQIDPNRRFHFQPLIDFLQGIAYNYQMDQ